MEFFVYIIQSLSDGTFYKGFTENPLNRLQQHNNLESRYTAQKAPWKMVYIEVFQSKKEALIRERAIKKYGHQRIAILINSPKNKISQFLLSQ